MTEKKHYEILFSRAREKRGLPAWGVFEIVSSNFSRGVSQHMTEEQAEAAMAELVEAEGQ